MSVNGIKLAAGQKWKTRNYGVIALSEEGASNDYPWRMDGPENGEPIAYISEDGKCMRWEDDELPELLEYIYNPEVKEEKKSMKFNPTSEPTKLFLPKPGDKIICNNGETAICCTIEFLQNKIAPSVQSSNPILGYFEDTSDWQDWDSDGVAHLGVYDWNIREIVPANTDKELITEKEEPKEIAGTTRELYTVDEIFDGIYEVTKHLEIEIPWDYTDEVKEYLSRKNDPQYQEYLRLKAIYE